VSAYRIVAADLRSGRRIADLPLADLSYSAVLNGVGEANGTLRFPPPSTPEGRALGAIWNDAVDEVRRLLIIERDGVVVWAGVIWASPYSDGDQSRQVHAADLWSYLRRRVATTSRNFRQVDQFQIARTLIQDAEAVYAFLGADPVIQVETGTLSGVLRDRFYPFYELPNVGESIEELAAVQNGFDFGIDVFWSGEDLARVVRFYYPRRGRPASETNLVFELGRNLVAFEWPSDGTRYANFFHQSGAGDGPATLAALAANTTSILPPEAGGGGYPVIQETESDGDISVGATLEARANARLASRLSPVVIPSVKVRADQDPVFGSYSLGDSARLIVPPGISPRFPDGLDTTRRIIGWTVNVDDQGNEEIDLVLGEDL
jgi:hypothetical protein